jgi:hypothetical protein
VQNGGTNLITGYFDMAGNAGGKGRYDLFGGQLIAPSEYIASSQTGLFYQHNGTNAVQGLVIGASQPSVTGAYYLLDGVLNAVDEGIDAQYPAVANLIQYGGTHQVSHSLNVGDQGQGLLEFAGGSLTAAQLVIGTGGSLHVNVGGQTNGIQVTGNAQLNSSLVLNLAPGYLPAPGDTWPIISYGSYQGTFARVTLPPATNGVAWQLSYLTNQLVLAATKLPNIIVVSPVSPTAQSNLYYQIVEITNPGAYPLAGARIFVPGLPPGTEVYNAAGSVAGVPYVEYDLPIAPGQTVEFYIQLFSQTPVAQPNLILDVINTNQMVNLPGPPLVLESPFQTSGGALVLGFNSVPNQTYYLQYSSNFVTWKTVALPIIGVGSHIEWTDAGPPKTDSAPRNQFQRFYRLFSSPCAVTFGPNLLNQSIKVALARNGIGYGILSVNNCWRCQNGAPSYW